MRKCALLRRFYSNHKLAVQSKLGLQRLAQLVARAAVVHLKFRAGSTIPVPVCTVPSSMDRTSRCHKVDAVRLYASYRLNLLLLKGKRSVICKLNVKIKYLNIYIYSLQFFSVLGLRKLSAPARVYPCLVSVLPN